MLNILEKCVSGLMPAVEGFEDNPLAKSLPLIISVVVSQIVLLLVGKFLWNRYLVKAVSFAKPITSIVQLFAVSVLLRLFVS